MPKDSVADTTTPLSRRLARMNLTLEAVSSRMQHRSGGLLKPDPSLIWRWVKGYARPGNRYSSLFAAALEIDETTLRKEIAAGYRKSESNQVDALRERQGEVDAAESELLLPSAEPGNLQEVMEMLERRSILKAVGNSALSIPFIDLSEILGTAAAGNGAIEGLGVMTDHLARNFDQYRYYELDLQLRFHLKVLASYLQEKATLRQQAELFKRGAQLSGLLGLSSFLQGRVADAWSYYSTARQLADEIGDRKFIAFVAAEEIAMACFSAQYRLGEKLVVASQGVTRSTGQIADLATSAARIYARLGMRTEAIQAIDYAEKHFTNLSPDEDCDKVNTPIWEYSMSSGLTEVGESWLALDELENAHAATVEAARVIEEGCNPRHASYARLIQSSVHARHGEPEEACRVATEVLRRTPQDVHTISCRLGDLLVDLQPFGKLSAVQDFQEVVRRYRNHSLGQVS